MIMIINNDDSDYDEDDDDCDDDCNDEGLRTGDGSCCKTELHCLVFSTGSRSLSLSCSCRYNSRPRLGSNSVENNSQLGC